jgi:hypothetical protein
VHDVVWLFLHLLFCSIELLQPPRALFKYALFLPAQLDVHRQFVWP